ncbi:MAG: restriction endonuclease subunit S [Truepera sp.]|nr:restriction endonuclease subunit S [Truepera sp.]
MAKQLDLPHHYRQHLETLLRRHLPTVEVWAYGSRVKGQSLDGSDLDLVLRSPDLQQIPADSLASFSEALQESTIPFLVAAHDWARLPESCHPEIEREHLVLVAADSKSLDQQNSGMEGKWRELCWGDLATLEYGRALRGHNSRTGPIRVFGTNGPIGWHDEALCSYPSVVVGRKGAYRGVHYSAEPFFVIDTAFYLKPKVELDTLWAYYQLLTQDINGLDSGSAIPSTRREDFYNLPVQVPPLPEQRTIAQILGTLDDKIELNRQLNETLEELVRAIFKDWFVDFGPVRAKLEGRDTGLPEQLAELFPDRLVESELGEIPEGWKISTVGECFNLTMGQSPPGSTYNEQGEGLPFFQGRSDFGFRYPQNRKFCTAPTRIAQPGDTLVSVRAPVGDINMAWERCCIGRGVAALRHKSTTMSFSYYSTWRIQRELQAYEHTGTVFGAINKGQFEALKVIEPSPDIVATFDSYAQPLDGKIRSNVAESRILTALRDTLLPRLMSGEMRSMQF